ncbi:RagB/SusD family nutrient uptake outer membrane protein [Chitinophaga sancti]|uniref:RagB/SusD family nutrient uptake outer membrane protein n=1 Tax=Chitinophaga sancti TaxID=1004 RepID=UPI002A751DA2|nr:RagB/SusD family nutrient uptake outer membrane protein [Chitinophaga sancti]WPQ63364.1 RagB/SusD family nutrient uptake outer membrane protein [Chitinophaga sancti]
MTNRGIINLFFGSSMKFKRYLGIIGIFIILFGCNKLVDITGPDTSANTDNVYNSDETAVAVLNGVYLSLSAGTLLDGNTINSFMSFYPGLSSDELTLYSNDRADYIAYYTNNLTDAISPNIWLNTYPVIYTLNSALEGLNKSEKLTPAIKKQLLGETRFMRAFCYFYLVNLYGDVPLILTTDYKVNASIARSDKNVVMNQIIDDLKEAESLMTDNYYDINVKSITTERTAPIKWAATALLARAYLYMKDYANADLKATSIINHSELYSLEPLKDVFLANSSEAIFQLQPVNYGWNTEDARVFILPAEGPSSSYPVYLSNQLLLAFEPGDMRRSVWVDSVTVMGTTYFYPYKYKSAKLDDPVTEYEMVLRLGEQYLIRAEAKAQLGDLSAAVDNINVMRNRAGLENYNGPQSLEDLSKAILHERQIELFSEWGNRWLDLKRTNSVDSVMSKVTIEKGGIWKSSSNLYAIPQYDLLYNSNLVQNEGY